MGYGHGGRASALHRPFSPACLAALHRFTDRETRSNRGSIPRGIGVSLLSLPPTPSPPTDGFFSFQIYETVHHTYQATRAPSWRAVRRIRARATQNPILALDSDQDQQEGRPNAGTMGDLSLPLEARELRVCNRDVRFVCLLESSRTFNPFDTVSHRRPRPI